MTGPRDPDHLAADDRFREIAELLGASCARLAEKRANALDEQRENEASCHALVNGHESRTRKGHT